MGFLKVVSPSELVGRNSLQHGPAHPNVASLLLVPAKLYGHGYVEEWRNMGEYPPPFHHSLEANGRKLEILQSTEQPITCTSSSAPFSPSLSALNPQPPLPFPASSESRTTGAKRDNSAGISLEPPMALQPEQAHGTQAAFCKPRRRKSPPLLIRTRTRRARGGHKGGLCLFPGC